MSAQRTPTGLVVALSFFVLLSLVLGVVSYMQTTAATDEAAKRQAAEATIAERDTSLRNQSNDIAALKTVVGDQSDEVGAGEGGDVGVVPNARKVLSENVADGSAAEADLISGVRTASAQRDTEAFSANQRLTQYNGLDSTLKSTISAKDAQIKQAMDAKTAAEAALRAKEQKHSEELAAANAQNKRLTDQLNTTRSEYSSYQTRATAEIEELKSDKSRMREALLTLRRRLMEQEDLSFDRPDGLVTFADQNAGTVAIDLGSRDGLTVGTTFSVYRKSNNGVGRRNTEDIKGQIEVVEIQGNHAAEARITDQKIGEPIADGDPIYSPLFNVGQEMKFSIVGLIDFDGNPGSDREELRRMIETSGATINNEVGDDGEFIIREEIDYRTKFLVIGDLGDQSATEDTQKKELYTKMQKKFADLRESAENNGVYVVSLSNFLEFLGYASKRTTWKQGSGQDLPARLSLGSRSERVNDSLKQRASLTPVTGLFTDRRTAPTPSAGAVSGLFRNK